MNLIQAGGMKGMRHIVFLTAAMAALILSVLGVTAVAHANTLVKAAHCKVDGVPSPAREYKITDHRTTLAAFALRHDGADPATVLGFTATCAPGWQSRAMLSYIDRGNWHAPLPKGARLWALPVSGG